MRDCEAAVEAAVPGLRFLVFGHLGDGNLHYNLQRAPQMTADDFLGLTGRLHTVVHDLVERYRGSISPEPGAGQLRRGERPRSNPAVAMRMLIEIKQLFARTEASSVGKERVRTCI